MRSYYGVHPGEMREWLPFLLTILNFCKTHSHDWNRFTTHATSSRLFISPPRVSSRTITLSNLGQGPPLQGFNLPKNGLSGCRTIWWFGFLRHCIDTLPPSTPFNVCLSFTKYWQLPVYFFHWLRNACAILSTPPTNVWKGLWSIRSLA